MGAPTAAVAPVAAVEPELPATNVQFTAIDDVGCEACQ
jgi:ribonucleoside-diphosphate reductase alpha chain